MCLVLTITLSHRENVWCATEYNSNRGRYVSVFLWYSLNRTWSTAKIIRAYAVKKLCNLCVLKMRFEVNLINSPK